MLLWALWLGQTTEYPSQEELMVTVPLAKWNHWLNIVSELSSLVLCGYHQEPGLPRSLHWLLEPCPFLYFYLTPGRLVLLITLCCETKVVSQEVPQIVGEAGCIASRFSFLPLVKP